MASWTSGWTWGGGYDDEQEAEEGEMEQSRQYITSKDCLILLIECTRGMFTATDADAPFQLCMKVSLASFPDPTQFSVACSMGSDRKLDGALIAERKCVRSVLLNKIVSSEKDLVGIIFFGTDKHKNPSDFEHVYIFQDLDTPDATRIREVERMLEPDSDFSSEYGHSDVFSLSDVLWTCSTMLATSGTKYSHKRILLFTNNDNPHATSPALQRQAKTRAKDLAENGVEIELMHIGSSFDISAFYQDVIFTGDEEITTLPDPSEKFEELLARVRSKEFKKRTMQKIPLSLGPGLEIGVGVYCLVREAKKPNFIRLDKRTNKELTTQTKLLCEDTGSVLMPTDIKYYQEFGGEKVVFEKEEIAEMKKFSEPGLTLMGFKPRSKLKRHFYAKPSNFIYPDESVITGSTKLFSALLECCLKREVMAICRYIPRTNTPPCFVALVPQEEELDETNVQVSPPGFHVIFLPFAEDLRKLHYEETPKASTEQIDKAKEIIKKLTFNFQSEAFENPMLQKHYRHLEAIALEHEEVEEVVDLTEPDVDRISKRAGALLDQFWDMVYPAGYNPEKSGTKRKAPSAADSGSGAATKRSHGAGVGETDVEAEARKGNLKKLTVPVLKEYLKSIGKKAVGKKQDLVDAINEHLGL